MKKQNRVQVMALCAVFAALYAVVSLVLAPFSFGEIQCRISEALTLLPLIFPEGILAVTFGCLITNIVGVLSGANVIIGPIDIVFGTLATLVAAILTYKLRNVLWFKQPILAAFMPVLLNGIVIGAELAFVLSPDGFNWIVFFTCAMQVAIGEAVAVYVLGLPLINKLKTIPFFKERQA